MTFTFFFRLQFFRWTPSLTNREFLTSTISTTTWWGNWNTQACSVVQLYTAFHFNFFWYNVCIKQAKFHSTRQYLVGKSSILLFSNPFFKTCTQCTLKGHSDRQSESFADRQLRIEQTWSSMVNSEFHGELQVLGDWELRHCTIPEYSSDTISW